MVGFGNQLQREARPAWVAHYIQYTSLKRLIAEATGVTEEAAAPALAQKQEEFERFLDSEVQKVLAFYKYENQALRSQATTAVADGRAVLKRVQSGEVPQLAQRLRLLDAWVAEAQLVTDETTHLLDYVSLNFKAMRKILKKYRKHIDPLPPHSGFMTLEVEHPHEHWKLLQGTLLPDSVAAELTEMQRHEALLQAAADLAAVFADAKAYRDRLASQSSKWLPRFGGRLLSTVGRDIDALGRDIDALQEAERHAARNAVLVHPLSWAECAAGIFEPPPPDHRAVATTAGLLINNLSAVLFMANYTAVLPPTERLCRRVGVSPSWTGAIMAASDAVVLFSSVGMSFWTQRSFKQPFLFSAASCFVSNIVFVLAYQYRSLPLLLVSRMLNGLGSARTANRRYVADYVSRKQRTMASAALVGCANLGQALGPFLSLPLALMPDYHVAGMPFNHVTAVGWAMAALWMLFFVLTVVCFQEPSHRLPIGLPESNLQPASEGEAQDAVLGQPLLPSPSEADENGLSDGEQPAAHVVQIPPPSNGSGAKAWWPTAPATLACVACLFVQKAVQQVYMDGVPLFMGMRYGWRLQETALFLSGILMCMTPVNVAVGVFSARVSDRTMLIASVVLSIASLLVLMAAAVSVPAYIAGGVAVFVGNVVLEGTATSLMSKVIWSGLAKGVLNAGLLSTEAGTLGRFSGNALLTLVGRATGVEDATQLRRFAEVLHGTLAGVCGVLLVQLLAVHGRLGG